MSWLAIGAISGFLGVALGAFGAHGLKDKLLELGTTQVFEKAVLYHFVHTLALLATALLIRMSTPTGLLRAAPWCFAFGILIFSGSLYALALTNIKSLGAVTPIGGVFFLAGWAALAIGAR